MSLQYFNALTWYVSLYLFGSLHLPQLSFKAASVSFCKIHAYVFYIVNAFQIVTIEKDLAKIFMHKYAKYKEFYIDPESNILYFTYHSSSLSADWKKFFSYMNCYAICNISGFISSFSIIVLFFLILIALAGTYHTTV